MNGDDTRWSVRRQDAIEASLFLIAVIAGVVAAIWLPPALFHTSQRLVSLRLALLSVSGGAVLGLVIAVMSLMRNLQVVDPRSSSAEPAVGSTRVK